MKVEIHYVFDVYVQAEVPDNYEEDDFRQKATKCFPILKNNNEEFEYRIQYCCADIHDEEGNKLWDEIAGF